MADKKQPVVVTYNGVDGACAAAMVLLRHPQARIMATSAKRIGQALTAIAEDAKAISEVLVCGVGVYCDWDDVAVPCHSLRDGGVDVTWYCGRGYLQDRAERFAEICTPVFDSVGTNTAIVCQHLGLEDDANALKLIRLARVDPNIYDSPRRVPEELIFWRDLIESSVAQYFKYQDEDAYLKTISKLPRWEYDERDERDVAVFRKAGFAHVLWGQRTAMGLLRDRIRRCGEADDEVLILGESGVGKEYVAHLIHERSRRAMGPMIPVNCAMFAGNAALANSMLFGHLKGAFTGAIGDRDGAFVSADSGILFLDEIGELPVDVQGKFLRVLEDGWVYPEGADKPRKVDVRVVAATNHDLPDLVRRGLFRADLFHRLNALIVHVPPLREHIEDIRIIADQILPTLVDEGSGFTLSPRDLKALQSYDWPGNVRQLIKVLRRAISLRIRVPKALEEERALGDLSVPMDQGEDDLLWPGSVAQVVPMKEMRSRYAARALQLHGGNYRAAARTLGIAANTLRSYVAEQE